jgi:uncharacterized protein (TIGR04255 family)
MVNASQRLRNPPIVEAVLDIDCDLPPGFDLAALEVRSRALFADQYPKFRIQLMQEFEVEAQADTPRSISARPAVQAFRCLHDDERQLVQVRAQGFSFNRLAPYSTFDDYLAEIERTWSLYVELVSPVQIRVIRLRYINRILLPMQGKKVDLDEFLKIGPRLPDEERLLLNGFLAQQIAVEKETGHQVNLLLSAQAPENDKLPIILDITVGSLVIGEPGDWSKIRPIIVSLRALKNHIFFNTLTSQCITLFQS